MTEVMLFNRWSFDDVEVGDFGLAQYIAVKQYGNKVFIPHTSGRYQKKRFRKASCPIVERLVCSLMMHGRNNGKKLMATRIVKHTFEIIHLLTDENPIQVSTQPSCLDVVLRKGYRILTSDPMETCRCL
uniref:Small ribosomal subunit protein uS7 domain-containing protein n=1 Tax=Rhodosorus marinus TaxID=101924 RepID=A0A7S2ZL69_9RHOD|mmetsp:Transcript_23637/g.93326  ORF Transcript_23637/g.93326 Transcript_23637/m.93326 type:complete len:129 (+) Transcript_23637:90-476(+)